MALNSKHVETVIQVRGLSKHYRLGAFGFGSLREDINQWFEKRHDRKQVAQNKTKEVINESVELMALDNINFDVHRGEILGIIGRNGAGKSTLLKILSRITSPSSGSIKIKGRIGSLLEVGTGFHPELTGRENIFLNGAILGMTRSEIASKFEQIVDFSEMARFIDTPVKRYSSGMTVRLAFSVAAHLEPEILIVDEVLAVGDVEFQKKCIGKMEDVADHGRTVLFVSHNMNVIQSLCTRGILLNQGQLEYEGSIEETTSRYMSGTRETQSIKTSDFRGGLKQFIEFESLKVNDHSLDSKHAFSPSEPISITLTGDSGDDFKDAEIFVALFCDGFRIATLFDQDQATPLKEGRFESRFTIAGNTLNPARYSIQIGAQSPKRREWMISDFLASFSVIDLDNDHLQQRKRGPVNIVNQNGRRKQ